jgi:outer membrane protein TolC
MGSDRSADFEIAEPADQGADLERIPTNDMARTAEQRRPEIARIDAQLQAQRAAGRGARAGYLPTVAAVANVSGAKVEGFDAGYNWYVGVGLNWNLFNGMLTTRQSEEADANIDVASAQRESVRQLIRAEVQEQLLGIADAQQRQLLSQRVVTTATERLRQAEDRLQTGAGDALDLDDAQVSLANAKTQSVQARYDLAIARARLRRALGED